MATAPNHITNGWLTSQTTEVSVDDGQRRRSVQKRGRERSERNNSSLLVFFFFLEVPLAKPQRCHGDSQWLSEPEATCLI